MAGVGAGFDNRALLARLASQRLSAMSPAAAAPASPMGIQGRAASAPISGEAGVAGCVAGRFMFVEESRVATLNAAVISRETVTGT